MAVPRNALTRELTLAGIVERSGRLGLPEATSIAGLICLDEVGRGCLAGPVVAGASLWLYCNKPIKPVKLPQWIPLLRDSKKLSANERQRCFDLVCQDFSWLSTGLGQSLADGRVDPKGAHFEDLAFGLETQAIGTEVLCRPGQPPLPYELAVELANEFANRRRLPGQAPYLRCVGAAIGAASVREIEEFNIWRAVQLAMGRAMQDLWHVATSLGADTAIPSDVTALGLQPSRILLLVDGKAGILVPPEFQGCLQVTAIGGDDLFASIGLSSILAKVCRDKFMEDLHQRFPEFDFLRNKGYGTQAHRDALVKHPVTPWHRMSFLQNLPLWRG